MEINKIKNLYVIFFKLKLNRGLQTSFDKYILVY